MADHTISITPPTSGTISLNAGDALIISASASCTLTCSAGDSFSPSLSSASLSAGDNGPFIAEQPVNNATYSASAAETARIGVVRTMNAKSVQITP